MTVRISLAALLLAALALGGLAVRAADGPEARLHLLQGSSLHLLDIVRVDAATVAATPELVGTVIDRVTFR